MSDERSKWLAERILQAQTVRGQVSPKDVIAVLRALADYELWRMLGTGAIVSVSPQPHWHRGTGTTYADPALTAARFMHEIADAIQADVILGVNDE